MVELIVNGERKELDARTVSDVIQLFGLQANMVIVELNGQIPHRDQWNITEVQPGMKLEIVHFVGGG